MKRELALEFARVTEAAALAAHKWVGRGKKESADQAGVDAMRTMLNRLAIDGEIVIGEGEIDEAPMLYIGEKVGLIYNEEEKDSATYVDPVFPPTAYPSIRALFPVPFSTVSSIILLIFSETSSDITFLTAVGVFLITTIPSPSVIFSTKYGLYRVPPFTTAEKAVII